MNYNVRRYKEQHEGGAMAYSKCAYKQFSLDTDYTRDGIEQLIDR